MAVAEPVSSELIFLILLVIRVLPVADFNQSGDPHQFRFRDSWLARDWPMA